MTQEINSKIDAMRDALDSHERADRAEHECMRKDIRDVGATMREHSRKLDRHTEQMDGIAGDVRRLAKAVEKLAAKD